MRLRQQKGAQYAQRLTSMKQAQQRKRMNQPIIHPVEEVFYDDE